MVVRNGEKEVITGNPTGDRGQNGDVEKVSQTLALLSIFLSKTNSVMFRVHTISHFSARARNLPYFTTSCLAALKAAIF